MRSETAGGSGSAVAGPPGGGRLSAVVEEVGGRPAIVARMESSGRQEPLTAVSGEAVAAAATHSLEARIPFVAVLSTSGTDLHEGVEALHGWGRAAKVLASCSGVVPVAIAVAGPTLAGPSLLLGLADIVVMSQGALAYVSGPQAVQEMTARQVDAFELGGASVHGRLTGVATAEAETPGDALATIGDILSYLPPNADDTPPIVECDDPLTRPTPELGTILPASATGAYDVREVISAIVDHGELMELRPRWAPQLVTALAHVGGHPVGIVANQPMMLAGTLDIAASQKGARFVSFCDSFNIPLLTLVDTPGFLPGKDLEWRGMIRHGAELAFAYAEATVPRICLVMRKAYGGAYIVMDSKAMGSDLTFAWPQAEIAVMGAQGAAQILHRRDDPATRAAKEAEYKDKLLTPWVAAERGLVDDVIDPQETRSVISSGLATLLTKRERLRPRKHANGPL